MFLGNEPMLTVAEPELVKDILVKDFHNFVDRRHLTTFHEIVNLNLFFVLGQQWKRIRTIVSPSFSNTKLKSMYHLMEKCIDNTISFIGNQCKEGVQTELDMKRVLGNLTMDVIASTAFAAKIESNIEQNNPFLVNATKFFKIKAYRYFAAFLLPQCILKHVLKSQFDESTNQFFINISRHIIKTRRTHNIRHSDLIQLLMDAKIEDSQLNENKFHNKKLTENEILAQCWVIFLAGYETTSTTLSFAIYEMALDQTIQHRLFEEVWKGTKYGVDFSFESINKLVYLKALINETLRKYPPLIRLERTATNDYVLGNTNITIPKGHVVEIPVYAMHHSEENYSNPEKFDPDRFMPENLLKLKPYTFIPFGLGSRNCVGLKFALMEIKLALCKLIIKFKFHPCSKTQNPMKFNTVTPFLQTKFNYLNVENRVINLVDI